MEQRSIKISCILNTFLRIKGGWPIASIRRIKIDLINFVGIGMFTKIKGPLDAIL